MEWLFSLTTWLTQILYNLWNSATEWMADFWVNVAESILSAFALSIELIPVPAFLSSYSVSSILSPLPSDLLYFVSYLHLPGAFSIIGAGLSFRLLRKVFTVFQW